MVDFPEKLKVLRSAKGLTQQQLADRLNITKSLISAYETNIRMPSIDNLIKLSKVLGVTTDYLLNIEKRQMIDVSNLSQRQIEIVISLIDELQEYRPHL
jgi:transcriptional regulator with XRE-family HTH domain